MREAGKRGKADFARREPVESVHLGGGVLAWTARGVVTVDTLHAFWRASSKKDE